MQNRIRPAIVLLFLCLFGPIPFAIAQCSTDENYWDESWSACTKTTNPNPGRGTSFWILYEFTEPIGIGKTHIWNANKKNKSTSGLKNVFIDVSVDGANWQQVGDTALEWEKAPETADYEGFEGPTLSNYGQISKLLITVESTHGDLCASLAEIRFEVDKNACAGQLDACGVCDGPGILTFYLDADSDGQGNQNTFIQACELPEQGYVENNNDPCDTGGWEQIGTIFEANSCTGCHNQNGEGGLDLTSYMGFLKGGDKCGTNIHYGNTLSQIIQIDGYDECGEAITGLRMNSRVNNQLDALEIAAIQAWIDAGAPEGNACQDRIEDRPKEEAVEEEEEATEEPTEYDGITRLYPNPSKGPVNIKTAIENYVLGVDVYDMHGKIIYQQHNDDKTIKSFDLGHLNQQGVYMVRLTGRFENGAVESIHKILVE